MGIWAKIKYYLLLKDAEIQVDTDNMELISRIEKKTRHGSVIKEVYREGKMKIEITSRPAPNI
ncbi:hypothetical protein [Paenibacillus sp. FSL P4-0288]|uniref:hypothetical protein n=1 Tax=Paenibacillus sp. FSL P4-0288 TaxID=2921633 RepID=UPI0030F4BE97